MLALSRNDSREIAPHAPKALIEILAGIGDEQVSGVLAQRINVRLQTRLTLSWHRVDHVGEAGPILCAEVRECGDLGLVDRVRFFEDDRYVSG